MMISVEMGKIMNGVAYAIMATLPNGSEGMFAAFVQKEARDFFLDKSYLFDEATEKTGATFRPAEVDIDTVTTGVKIASNAMIDLVTGQITKEEANERITLASIVDSERTDN